MQLNVSQLFKEPVGSARQCEINETTDINGNSYKVQGKIKLVRAGQSILVKGTLLTEANVNCSRCLSLFRCPLTLKIEEEYFPTIDLVSGAPLSLPETPDHCIIDEQYVLDLTEAIHQYIMLAIPMKPLCREGCAGICATCGHNLNQGPCGCQPQELDPRWSELAKLTLDNNA